ncbi:hypothetical protein [Gynuella sunshinyii]|uniref:hypothetical protein n=1 Tax=Gynuella sunshinyii TaxID=1445505 RepID=UPI0005CC0A01|nr:hypothetical protein [Gynuella sunshinyii]
MAGPSTQRIVLIAFTGAIGIGGLGALIQSVVVVACGMAIGVVCETMALIQGIDRRCSATGGIVFVLGVVIQT